MRNTECVVIKIKSPTKNKQQWLTSMADLFLQSIEIGLVKSKSAKTSSRTKLHPIVYPEAKSIGLPSDYCRMAVNSVVSMLRSYEQLKKVQHNTSFPKINKKRKWFGLGTNAYAIENKNGNFILRATTQKCRKFIWLPLCVPDKFKSKISNGGDAKIIQRGQDWYVILPVKTEQTPTACSGEPTFIGVDLGIVRIAVVSTPTKTIFFNGQSIRNRREHFTDLRKRYQKHNRLDRVRQQKGKESRWMTDINHKLSKQIVAIATQSSNPMICLERLDGIRYRIKKSKRFNRMLSSWAFRQLLSMIEYKAMKANVKVKMVDPRRTSRKCSKCGHDENSNRKNQSTFKCKKCGYETNADRNASKNISAVGASLYQQGLSDTARSRPQGLEQTVAL